MNVRFVFVGAFISNARERSDKSMEFNQRGEQQEQFMNSKKILELVYLKMLLLFCLLLENCQ